MSFLSRSLRSTATRSLTRAAVAPCAVVARAAPLAAATRSASIVSHFTTTVPKFGSGSTDVELASRLQQELSYEQEVSGSQTHSESAEPDFLRDFKSTGIWSIKDVPGSDEVALERTFGNEKITVLFSIGDIDSADPLDEMDENEDGEENEDDSNAFPVRVAISITKPNGGALTIDAQADDATFEVENVSYYQDAKLASELSAEADWKRRGLYIGPQFPTLDEEVQNHFVAFLEERGINDDLALFIPLLAEYKEQKEYVAWLGNVKKFVEA